MRAHWMRYFAEVASLEAGHEQCRRLYNDPGRVPVGKIVFLMNGGLAAGPWVFEVTPMKLKVANIIADL